VHVRPASEQDEPWIRSLIPRLHEFGPPPYRDFAAMNAAEAAATAAAIDGGDERTVLVAVDEAAARLGFVHLETSVDFFTRERHGHISTIVVSRDAEGRGVARVLLDAAEAWCRERGYRLLTLNVFEGNDAARRLYERAGFRVDTIKYLKPLR
jgi:ribosomal protein S18 acetylase RimI-like enzyme